MSPMIAIPADAHRAPIEGRNLDAATLGELLAGEPTLLVFLRHLG